jgi:hypothetical protein
MISRGEAPRKRGTKKKLKLRGRRKKLKLVQKKKEAKARAKEDTSQGCTLKVMSRFHGRKILEVTIFIFNKEN